MNESCRPAGAAATRCRAGRIHAGRVHAGPSHTGRCRAGQGLLWVTLLLLLMGPTAQARAEATALTLDDAVARALRHHPRLQIFGLRLRGLESAEQSAGQRPAYILEAEIEGFAGEGELQGFDRAEQTLALSSVIELGGQRSARLAAAQARTALTAAEGEAEALALLAEVTQRFVAALAAQRRLALAGDALDLARATLGAVEERARAGAAPAAEVLRAQAAFAQARIARAEFERALATERLQLAVAWGAAEADFGELRGELFEFAPAMDFDTLWARAEAGAALAMRASEARLRAAEVRLARAQAAGDIDWRLGIRRLEPTGDSGLVAGVSLPLFAGQRGRSQVVTAEAAHAEVALQTEATRLELRARLFETYQQRSHAIETTAALRTDVIPLLESAVSEARAAYQRGRYSYLELIAAQRELLDARHRAIEAAASAHAYGALIEQLTAQPLAAAPMSARRPARLPTTGQAP